MTSPGVPSDATDAIRASINLVWCTMVRDILSVIFTMPGLPLSYLGIGTELYTSTPLRLLTDIPKYPPMLSELKVLRLDDVREEENTEARATGTQTFGNFLTLLPNVEKIYYHGSGTSYPVLSYISKRFPYPPALSSLALLNISITETALLEGLHTFCPALRDLTLEQIKLTSGTWRPIFRFLHQSLCLRYVHLDDLTKINEHVLFDAVIL